MLNVVIWHTDEARDNGIGLLPGEDRYDKAAGFYQSAADTLVSAMAYWNLGWMYENGLGVPQVRGRRFCSQCN